MGRDRRTSNDSLIIGIMSGARKPQTAGYVWPFPVLAGTVGHSLPIATQSQSISSSTSHSSTLPGARAQAGCE